MQGNQIAKLVNDVCVASKTDMINGLPCVGVSGVVGNGFFCTPGALTALAWLEHVPEKARPNILAGALRYAMQRSQAALKAFDAKNKNATDEQRLAKAQEAFAGAIDGTSEASFNDSSLLRGEATRIFIDTKVKPWAVAQGKDTSDGSLEQYRAAIEKDNATAYPSWIESIMSDVAKTRTYAVNRKGTVGGEKIETSSFADMFKAA